MTTDRNREKLRELLFGVRMSIRYHRLRQTYFERRSAFFKFVSIVSATAVFGSLVAQADPMVATISSVVVALTHVLDLVTDPTKKARDHHDFAQKFTFLEQEVETVLAKREHEADSVAELVGKRLSIEAQEPPTLLWLALESRNEQIIAQKGPEAPEIVKIPWLQRRLLNVRDVFTYSGTNGASA